MLVILAVALLLISTIRTYAGTGVVMILDCDGDLLVGKSSVFGGDFLGCDTDESCMVGLPCAECIKECVEAGLQIEGATGASGKSRYVLVCPTC